MRLTKKELKIKVTEDISSVFKELFYYFHEDNPEFDEIISLQARYNDIIQSYTIKGTWKNDEYSIEINKIRDALIIIINKIDFHKNQEISLLHWWNELPHEWEVIFEANNVTPNEKRLKFLFEKQNNLSIHSDDIENLTPLTHLKNLKSLDISSRSLKYLEGIENLVNLEKLTLTVFKVNNLELLQNLINIKELTINYLPATDLSPIKYLKNLSTLNIFHSHIDNIIFLENLEQLEYLHFYQTQIEDLDLIKNLQNLVELRIGQTPLKSIEPITKLKKLKVLKLEDTKIMSLDGIEDLINLEELVINNFKITNLIPFYNLKKLKNFNFKYNKRYISMDEIRRLHNQIPFCALGYSYD